MPLDSVILSGLITTVTVSVGYIIQVDSLYLVSSSSDSIILLIRPLLLHQTHQSSLQFHTSHISRHNDTLSHPHLTQIYTNTTLLLSLTLLPCFRDLKITPLSIEKGARSPLLTSCCSVSWSSCPSSRCGRGRRTEPGAWLGQGAGRACSRGARAAGWRARHRRNPRWSPRAPPPPGPQLKRVGWVLSSGQLLSVSLVIVWSVIAASYNW